MLNNQRQNDKGHKNKVTSLICQFLSILSLPSVIFAFRKEYNETLNLTTSNKNKTKTKQQTNEWIEQEYNQSAELLPCW